MVILGAGGHAKEVYDVICERHQAKKISFFDDVSDSTCFDSFYKSVSVIRCGDDLRDLFSSGSPDFVLGVGNPSARFSLFEKVIGLGGHPASAIAGSAFISKNSVIGTLCRWHLLVIQFL